MRLLSKVRCLSAVLCVSCAPAEVARVAVPPDERITASPSSVDSLSRSRLDSLALTPSGDAPEDSIPVKNLRDSLSVEGNPEPRLPIVFADVCPGEGCTFGTWIACKSITVLSEPRVDASVAFVLNRRDTLVAVTGNNVVERAGKIIFRDTVRAGGLMERYLFTPADTLYPLAYDGEGDGRWFFHGRIGGGEWFFNESDSTQSDPRIVMVRERKTHWWVKARNRDGREGWFRFQPMIAVDPEGHYENSCPPQ